MATWSPLGRNYRPPLGRPLPGGSGARPACGSKGGGGGGGSSGRSKGPTG